MRLKTVRIKNFRCYLDSGNIDIGKLTAFVGRNDIGKSTILEALDLFFNEGKGAVELEKDDVNLTALSNGVGSFSITCLFDELPNSIVVDSTYETTLQDEFLTNSTGCVEIEKVFSGSKLLKILLHANHPSHPQCADLLSKKNKELKRIVSDLNLDCENESINAALRKTIRAHFESELACGTREIDVTKGDDLKTIWDGIKSALPLYNLFRADRENSDTDDEVQDPIKACAKKILSEPNLQAKLKGVADHVITALSEVVNRTYMKLSEMAPSVAAGLKPRVPNVEDLKWADVFKGVSISGVDNIPINKRGSGVKRLVLLNFFRAEVEHSRNEARGMIYAVEEPETSQHVDHQRLLIKSLKDLSLRDGIQVVLTTHSSTMVKMLGYDCLRQVRDTPTGRIVGPVVGNVLKYDSMIEASYLAFGEVLIEYHDQLWAVIEGEKKLQAFKTNRPTLTYYRIDKPDGVGGYKNEPHVLSHYVRDQIHHPENTLNPRFTETQLKQSIEEMRAFLIANP